MSQRGVRGRFKTSFGGPIPLRVTFWALSNGIGWKSGVFLPPLAVSCGFLGGIPRISSGVPSRRGPSTRPGILTKIHENTWKYKENQQNRAKMSQRGVRGRFKNSCGGPIPLRVTFWALSNGIGLKSGIFLQPLAVSCGFLSGIPQNLPGVPRRRGPVQGRES